jgi:hypothetical protein
MTTSWTITLDCTDPVRVSRFCQAALGYVEAQPPEGWATWEDWFRHFQIPEDEWNDGAALADPDGVLPRISLLKVPEPRTTKNRLHLDLQVSGGRHLPADVRDQRIRAEGARLVEAGATVVHEVAENGRLDHLWMADPEGNDFCVV